MTLSCLLAQVRGCRLCAAHLPHGPRPILKVDRNARILIASQAPGRKAHDSGVPFEDPSGVRLRQWMGIDREDFYDPAKVAIVPMGLCYPGTGRAGDLAPRPECASHWRQRLLAHLTGVELTLVIGRHAQRYHIGKPRADVTTTVRTWRQFWPHLVPLPHPSPRNNIWLRRNPWFEEEVVPELRKAVRALLARA